MEPFVTVSLCIAISWAAVWKVTHRWTFVSAILSWRLFTPRQARQMSLWIPGAEAMMVIAAFTLLLRSDRPFPATLPLTALFASFLVGQVLIVVRTSYAHCGCWSNSSPLGRSSMARVIGLIAVSAAPLLPSAFS